jgi:hypothetical protein
MKADGGAEGFGERMAANFSATDPKPYFLDTIRHERLK